MPSFSDQDHVQDAHPAGNLSANSSFSSQLEWPSQRRLDHDFDVDQPSHAGDVICITPDPSAPEVTTMAIGETDYTIHDSDGDVEMGQDEGGVSLAIPDAPGPDPNGPDLVAVITSISFPAENEASSAANETLDDALVPPSTTGPVLHQGLGVSQTAIDLLYVEEIDNDDPEALLIPPPDETHMPGWSTALYTGEHGVGNPSMIAFLRELALPYWSRHLKGGMPDISSIQEQIDSKPKHVSYADLCGDHCDLQGWDWHTMGMPRVDARYVRDITWKNYAGRGTPGWSSNGARVWQLPASDSFFRFHKMHLLQEVQLAHFQLRSSLVCPSRSQVLYPVEKGIKSMNLASNTRRMAITVTDVPSLSTAISTMDANHGVLFGGTFRGEYYLKSLDCADPTKFSDGLITSSAFGISNHVQIYKPRQSSALAACIASNDRALRVMDLQTETITTVSTYPYALNCTSISADGRLRVAVGDSSDVHILSTDTGEVQLQLEGHGDHGFSCDWADNGWHVATACQHRETRIWDARRWRNSDGTANPLMVIPSEMASVRNLRFSPTGGGHPVLVAAEEADYVNIVDAQTFETKQTIDLFSEIGGVAFTNDGHDLNVLCCDGDRGGLLRLERCGQQSKAVTRHAFNWHALEDDGVDDDYKDNNNNNNNKDYPSRDDDDMEEWEDTRDGYQASLFERFKPF